MKQVLVAFGLMCCSTMAEATVTTFTSSSDFHAANPGAVLIEDFENSDPALRETPLTSYTGPGGEITFTPVSSYPFAPNVWIDSPGHTDVAPDVSPTTSLLLAVTGNEDFVGTLASPAYALGFDVMLNDWPLTLSFYNGDTLLGTLTFDSPVQPGSNWAFAGISSTEGVTSFRWQATNGQYWDTGIDNIFAASAVPEPSTWAMMLLGFFAVGIAARRRRVPPLRAFT